MKKLSAIALSLALLLALAACGGKAPAPEPTPAPTPEAAEPPEVEPPADDEPEVMPPAEPEADPGLTALVDAMYAACPVELMMMETHAMLEKAPADKWICVMPNAVRAARFGDVVCCVMTDTSLADPDALIDAFETAAGGCDARDGRDLDGAEALGGAPVLAVPEG